MTSLYFVQHLSERGLITYNGAFRYWQDTINQLVTFPLWTVTGQLVGYQQYDWRSNKLRNNNPKGRYWTYRRRDVNTAWGLEYLNLSSNEPLYLCEGIFDAVSVINTGRRCLAVLSNNPKQLKPWLACLPCKTIAICEGDKAGKSLAKSADEFIQLPTDKDANDIELTELDRILTNHAHGSAFK